MEQFKNIQKLSAMAGRPIAVLDTETTGLLSQEVVGLVEIAWIVIDEKGIKQTFEVRVNPECEIGQIAAQTHGITNQMVANEPHFGAHAGMVREMLSTSIVSGFNVREFDLEVIKRQQDRYSNAVIPADIIVMDVRDHWIRQMGTKHGKLQVVADHYGVEAGKAHAAMGDVLTTARILDAVIATYGAEAMLGVLQEVA